MFSLHRHKFPVVTLLAAAAMLAAGCGGGGGDSPPPPAVVPPVEPAAVTSVPPPDYDSALRLSAFNRLNEVRVAAGLGLLKQNKLIDVAAQAHSVYQILNGIVTHTEIPGAPGFTGDGAMPRIAAAGYRDFTNTNEFVATLRYVGGVPDQAGAHLIDSLIGTPYHRSGMFSYEFPEVGIGVHKDGTSATITIDIAKNRNNEQGAPNTIFAIWPPADSQDIPTTMHSEIPDPIPENQGRPAGYPASIQVNSVLRSLEVKNFEIRSSSGVVVDTKLLSYETGTSNNDASFAAALPRSPLEKNTTYTVTFSGTIIEARNHNKTDVNKTWSFKTGNKDIF
jgi:uncharacterized protein YkwD